MTITPQNAVAEEISYPGVNASSARLCNEEGSDPKFKISGKRKHTDDEVDSSSDDAGAEVCKSYSAMLKSGRTETSISRKGKEPEDVDSESDMEDFGGVERDYYTDAVKNRWPYYYSRQCLSEKRVDVSSFKRYNVFDFLVKSGMMPTLSYAEPYIEKVVKLFYANMAKKFGDPTSKQFG